MFYPDVQTTVRPTVLLVGLEEKRQILSAMLSASGWKVCEGESVLDAVLNIADSPAEVIVTSSELPDGGWREVLDLVRPLGPAPRTIVTAPFVDDHFSHQLLGSGAYEVQPPSDLLELVRSVESAYLDWTLRGAAA